MKILVVGGSGYLGPSILQYLANQQKNAVGTYMNNRRSGLIHLDVTAPAPDLQLSEYDRIIWTATLYDRPSPLLEKINKNQRLVYVSSDVVGCALALEKNNNLGDYARLKFEEEKIVSNLDNSLIIRTGPIYGKNAHDINDKRMAGILQEVEDGNTSFKFWDNVLKNFVPVDKLSQLVCNQAFGNQNGLVFAGTHPKQSYYAFYKQIIESNIDSPVNIEPEQLSESKASELGVCFDTSYDGDSRAVPLD